MPDNLSPNQHIIRHLCQEIGMPVILSLNIELELNKQGEQELTAALAKLCHLHIQQK